MVFHLYSSINTLESDFVDTPITITISPGDTSALVFISIIDDEIVERNEVFDVVLQPQGNGVTIGSPGQAEVMIVDDDGEFIQDMSTHTIVCHEGSWALNILIYSICK